MKYLLSVFHKYHDLNGSYYFEAMHLVGNSFTLSETRPIQFMSTGQLWAIIRRFLEGRVVARPKVRTKLPLVCLQLNLKFGFFFLVYDFDIWIEF